jgi:hypothetical protein
VRPIRLALAALAVTTLAVALALGCAEDKREYKDKKPGRCHDAIETWQDVCGFSINLDGVNEMDYDAAYDSCVHGWGKTWELFIRCYFKGYKEGGDSCDAFADCAPKHGFISGEADDDTSPADDDDDDTSPADDDDDDTSPADDDDDTSPTDDDDDASPADDDDLTP